jgi:hypothetical protein
MEVQHHGLVFEDKVIQSITGMPKVAYQSSLKNGYTSSMDIHKGYNSDHNYSIKTSKEGKAIACGDILRFTGHCMSEPFKIVAAAWKQIDSNTKKFNAVYEFNMEPEYYPILWGGITPDKLTPFVEYVKNIPHGSAGQAANKDLWKQKRDIIYEECGKGIATIDAKIDSKSQRRVQCSIKIQDMIDAGIPFVKYDIEYKGIKLPYEQESSPRSF